jgi:hypothetical protein
MNSSGERSDPDNPTTAIKYRDVAESSRNSGVQKPIDSVLEGIRLGPWTSCPEPPAPSKWSPIEVYVLFFLHLESRPVTTAGIPAYYDQNGMQQIARNATCPYVWHDRDTKFSAWFQKPLIDHTCEVPGAAPPESKLERVGRMVGPIR